METKENVYKEWRLYSIENGFIAYAEQVGQPSQRMYFKTKSEALMYLADLMAQELEVENGK